MLALDEARTLLGAAGKDLGVLRRLLGDDKVAVEPFGFHAQQAMEKSLKAWLALRSLPYARTHSLGRLLHALEDDGEDVSGLWPWLV